MRRARHVSTIKLPLQTDFCSLFQKLLVPLQSNFISSFLEMGLSASIVPEYMYYTLFWIGILFLLSYFYFKFLYSGFARENHCRIYISVHYCVMFIHYHVGFFIAFCFIFSVFWFSMCLSFLCCSRSPQKKPFSVQGYHDTRTTKYELQLSPSNLQMLCLL